LPTEAEWEFACRAGTTTPFNTGYCLNADTDANFHGGRPYEDCPYSIYLVGIVNVGNYPPNQWGLFDMHGNVLEFCNDWEGDYNGDETDPEGPLTGNRHALRGGRYESTASNCRSAHRCHNSPFYVTQFRGIRPVRSVN